ncbi:MAG: hypothetical protein JWO03_3040 [Bacteroidetes bacterium]|nr:hypothetical protein [Bacteroidota bacterium]
MKRSITKIAAICATVILLAVGTAFAVQPTTTVADKYFIAAGEYPNTLAVSVNAKMAQGWVPEGGISSWTNPTTKKTYYLQAMVKK